MNPREHLLEITSTSNPRVKQAVSLRERSERNKTGLFLIEGYRELLRAVEGQFPLTELFFCRDLFLGSNEDRLIATIQATGTKLYSCSPAVFHKLSYRDRPDGLLAIGRQKTYTLKNLEERLKEKPRPLLLIAEAIEKPGNLGTLLRSSDAAGVDGVIVSDPCTDIYNPNVVRSSVGMLFHLPVVQIESAPLIQWLHEKKIAILAATPYADREFTAVDMTGPLAIVVGTEQLGLSDQWLNAADVKVRIPMKGSADSLNVAAAATLLLYEAVRQRDLKG